MPERVCKYESITDLIAIAKDLGASLRSGNTEELSNATTGFRVRTGPVTIPELRQLYMDCRYEIFLRGRGSSPTAGDGDPTCARLEPTDPRRERIMHVEMERGAVFFPPIRTV